MTLLIGDWLFYLQGALGALALLILGASQYSN